ncbi:MAG: cobaltochelatase subunit CobN [Burkholderiaceae bacterium]|nr:cobaltochelatase subunit CobN [Burkholderiaceae bacterium]
MSPRSIQAQAAALDLRPAEPAWDGDADADRRSCARLVELEHALIPHGLHVVGAAHPAPTSAIDMLSRRRCRARTARCRDAALDAIPAGDRRAAAERRRNDWRPPLGRARRIDRLLAEDHELPRCSARSTAATSPPAPGGDLMRTPEMLPTGRNIHGFDPVPHAERLRRRRRRAAQAERLLARHLADGSALPEIDRAWCCGAPTTSRAKAHPIAQALALMGTRPRFDGYGRLAGAELDPAGAAGPAARST